jgi:hypothetical protein
VNLFVVGVIYKTATSNSNSVQLGGSGFGGSAFKPLLQLIVDGCEK